jgi:hypothetical protein
MLKNELKKTPNQKKKSMATKLMEWNYKTQLCCKK